MCVDQEQCERQPDSWVIGWDQYDTDRKWFLVRETGSQLSTHHTHNEAMSCAKATDPNVQMFHEADGGGCLGPFDESPYDDNDNCY